MKLGLFSTFMSPVATPEMMSQFARRVEAMGFDSLWMGEHVVLFDKTEFPYPGSRDGKIPVPAGGGMLDTVASFGFLAASTTTLRLGTGITLLPQRNVVYTAKEFTTLDWLSNGRIDLGVGVGWCKEEVIACGYDFDDRGARCDEALEVLKLLWTQELASYEGVHLTLPPCRMDPKPVQKPHLPIIVGGHSAAGLRRAAKYGDGWYGFQMDVAATAEMISKMASELSKHNRHLADFRIIITPPYSVTPEMVRAYRDLGVDELVLHLGNQKHERVESRLAELEPVLAANVA